MTATIERLISEVKTASTMPIADITVHPQYRRRDLGKLRDLQRSIREHGLLRPVPVTADGILIAGERRLRACQNLGWDHIPVIIADDDGHAVELLAAEQANTGPCHLRQTASELVLVGLKVEEFERDGAESRRRAGSAHRPVEAHRASRDVAASITGLSQHHYIRIRPIVTAWLGYEVELGGYQRTPVSPQWAQRSRQALDLIDRIHAGEKITHTSHGGRRSLLMLNTVYREWKADRVAQSASMENISTDARSATVRARREALAKSLASLAGLCHGLASITEIDPAVTKEEAAAWGRDLSNASRTLRDLHLKIKEYANGIA